jgi:hypothetical protein
VGEKKRKRVRLSQALDALEKRMIIRALIDNRGSLCAAAISLGITERIMGLRIRKYGIDRRRYKKGAKAGFSREDPRSAAMVSAGYPSRESAAPG